MEDPLRDDTKPDLRACPACGREDDTGAKFCTEDGTPLVAAEPSDPLVGQVLMDRWEVLDRIGSGGFATIYEVREVDSGRVLALKAFDRRRVSRNDLEEGVARFRREARLLEQLGGLTPHIPTVDALVDDTGTGVMYLPMELVEGESLAAVVTREGTLPGERIVAIVRQVCEALRVAHGHGEGVVHRDLSLENIMTTGDPGGGEKITILDFGIAKAIGDEGLTNLSVGGPGTPAYAAPEQVEGREVDPRTDLFTLGVVIYGMLTGHEPWLGGSITDRIEGGWKMLRQTVDGDPIPVSRWNPDADPGLVRIVLRLLEKRPENRFQSAVEVIEALDAVERGEVLPAAAGPDRGLRVRHARAGVRFRVRKGRFLPRTVAEGETPWTDEDLPPGSYRVEVVDPRFGKEVRTVDVPADGAAEVTLTAGPR